MGPAVVQQLKTALLAVLSCVCTILHQNRLSGPLPPGFPMRISSNTRMPLAVDLSRNQLSGTLSSLEAGLGDAPPFHLQLL